jgi:NADH dehydrogenase
MPESMQSEAEKRLKLSKINFISKAHVVRITPNTVMLDNGKLLTTSTAIWCAGVSPVLPDMVGPVDKLALNLDLTLGDYKNVFALGDCINYGTSVPMDAQAAVKQASFVAQAISNALQGKSKAAAFSYVSSGQLISLGRWRAAGNIKGISFKGALAWWIWRTIYLIRFPSTSKRFKIMLDWTVSIFSERDMSNI